MATLSIGPSLLLSTICLLSHRFFSRTVALARTETAELVGAAAEPYFGTSKIVDSGKLLKSSVCKANQYENRAKWCTNQLAEPRMREIEHLCTKRQERMFQTKAPSVSKSTQSYTLTGETNAVEASNQSGFPFSIFSGMVH